MADDKKEDTTDEVEEKIDDEQTFDAKYVRKLRAEAAGFRTKLRSYEEPFKGFNEVEREYLLGLVGELDADPEMGAFKFRDLAKSLLNEKFYEGLDDAPVKKEDDDTMSEDESKPEKEEHVTLTKKELEEMFAARDARDEERAAKAAEDAEIEAVFKEVEDAGFVRGSEEFLTALSLANTQSQLGKDVNFAELAPKVRAIVGSAADAPAAEAEGEAVEGEEPAARFPKTATAGGSGQATEPAKDWVAEVRESGRNPMEVARERMEARLSASE